MLGSSHHDLADAEDIVSSVTAFGGGAQIWDEEDDLSNTNFSGLPQSPIIVKRYFLAKWTPDYIQ
jgi:hypothetical protein